MVVFINNNTLEQKRGLKMRKSLKVECANLVARIERKQSKRLIKQLHTLVECHAGNIVAAGIDAFQAFGIAGVLAGGGRVLAFGDGFVEVQNGMGETMTYRRGDEVYQSNPAADAGPTGDNAASPMVDRQGSGSVRNVHSRCGRS